MLLQTEEKTSAPVKDMPPTDESLVEIFRKIGSKENNRAVRRLITTIFCSVVFTMKFT